jgi:anthranilate synthase
LRALIEEFRGEEDSRLGLVGAFGYDLLFQFEPIEKKLPRHGHKDLHLFLCDDICFMDRKKEQIERYQYDFERAGPSPPRPGARRRGRSLPPPSAPPAPLFPTMRPEEYMAGVEKVRQGMRRGDYYEVVLRQTFRTPYSGKASELFERVQDASPSPYEFLLQFGDEQLVGASPEMFVRVEGRASRRARSPARRSARATRCATPRTSSELLKSLKEESELTMCTDVDRNDKSRVCEPGSVKVIGAG